jgi:hypothetical protein
MVGSGGLEPPTSSLSVTRSNQLSYEPTSLTIVFKHKTRYWRKIKDGVGVNYKDFE